MYNKLYYLVSNYTKYKRFKYLKEIENIPFLNEKEIEKIREIKIKKISEILSNSVYYKKIIVEKELKINEFPLLTREIILNNYNNIAIKNTNNLILSYTGGSTGVPMPYYFDINYRELTNAYEMRGWMWAGWHPGMTMVNIWGANYELEKLKTLRQRLVNKIMKRITLDAFQITEKHLENWVKVLNNIKEPFYIHGYVSSIVELFKYTKEENIIFKNLKGIITTAEKLYPEQKTILENNSGVKVYDNYGSRELWAIAATCKEGHLHINADHVIVEEIKNEFGEPMAVITDLDNLVFPMIRYVNGDLIKIDNNTNWECGIHFPVITEIVGRTVNNFITPEGKKVYGEYFTHLMYGVDGVEQFQFIQEDKHTIKLLLKSKNKLSGDKIKKMENAVRRDFSPNVKLEVIYTDKFEYTQSGKFLFTISKVKE